MPKFHRAAWAVLILSLPLTACGPGPGTGSGADASATPSETIIVAEESAAPVGDTASVAADLPELIPPAPGELGGLPDDRTPLAEGPIDPKSGQGAAQVVQKWAIALEQGKWADAVGAYGEGATTPAKIAAQYDKYRDVRVLVGGPGEGDGAAGSIYIEVPVQIYGRVKATGKPFNLYGPVTLRRVNGVDGATPAQLRWHFAGDPALKPLGTVREAAR